MISELPVCWHRATEPLYGSTPCDMGKYNVKRKLANENVIISGEVYVNPVACSTTWQFSVILV